jgi:hypothetical protein
VRRERERERERERSVGGAEAGGEMDAFYSSSSSAAYGAAPGAGWGYDSLKNFRQITPAVQNHLKLVRIPPGPSLPSHLHHPPLLVSSHLPILSVFVPVGAECSSGFGRPRGFRELI